MLLGPSLLNIPPPTEAATNSPPWMSWMITVAFAYVPRCWLQRDPMLPHLALG